MPYYFNKINDYELKKRTGRPEPVLRLNPFIVTFVARLLTFDITLNCFGNTDIITQFTAISMVLSSKQIIVSVKDSRLQPV